jgi:transcriptional regulator with XRE-family HTH domain
MESKTMSELTPLNSILDAIGRKLLELRLKKGYKSHADFAKDHALPRIQYWRMEKGKSNVTLRSLCRVLAAHDLSIEELFDIIAREKRDQRNSNVFDFHIQTKA